jgi:hypothetical protein
VPPTYPGVGYPVCGEGAYGVPLVHCENSKFSFRSKANNKGRHRLSLNVN